jgi:hypothetical protein
VRALTEDERTKISVWRIGVAYSDRSASTALILVARIAGRDAARIATKSNTSGAPTNVGGSNAGIPYRNDEISLASQIETAKPITMPMVTNCKQCFTTKRMTLPVLAPSAMRMPNSLVRWVTE